MTKVDARSLSIPAKLANLSEVSQLKSEFQVSLELVFLKRDTLADFNH